MISGREALSRIDQALTTKRGKTAEIESRIEAIEHQSAALRQAQAQDYKALARLRLGQLADTAIVNQMDDTGLQVTALLAQRQDALGRLKDQAVLGESALRSLEAERAAQAAQVDAAAQAVDAAEARTQARLEADPAYQAQRARTTDAERMAAHAAEKADRSASEREEKGVSYRDDPLFMYLWKRRYGQAGYKAWPLTRWLDGKVARLIGYADAGANYGRLNEIPERLREHADTLAAAAGVELAALKSLDEAARLQDGIPALDVKLAEAQEVLDAIDQRIAQAETDQQTLDAQKARYVAGDDEITSQALELMASELRREDLMELRREALATPFPEDDLIVARLLEREDESRRLDGSLQALKESLAHSRQRLAETESLRADFKRNRYDRSGSQFGDHAMIAMMLGQFLNGALDRHNLWRILQEQQRYRPERSDPGFGSGGFGQGTVWGGGVGDLLRQGDVFGGSIGRGGIGRSGGGVSRPRGGSGGASRGGFRTGGGF